MAAIQLVQTKSRAHDMMYETSCLKDEMEAESGLRGGGGSAGDGGSGAAEGAAGRTEAGAPG